jgi:hypothetical protein
MSDFLRSDFRGEPESGVVIFTNQIFLPENNYFGIFEEDKIPYFFGGLK